MIDIKKSGEITGRAMRSMIMLGWLVTDGAGLESFTESQAAGGIGELWVARLPPDPPLPAPRAGAQVCRYSS